jgi:hypothetical protein
LQKLDPIREGQGWLDFSLKVETDFTPETIPRDGHPHYVALMTTASPKLTWLVWLTKCDRPWRKSSLGWKPNPNQK